MRQLLQKHITNQRLCSQALDFRGQLIQELGFVCLRIGSISAESAAKHFRAFTQDVNNKDSKNFISTFESSKSQNFWFLDTFAVHKPEKFN